MMLKVAKLGIAIAAVLAWIVPAVYAGVPATTESFYLPEAGSITTPTVGTLATRLFRICPNNDGGTSAPNSARIQVVVRNSSGNAIPGVAAADICLLFNGGTPAQGFSGVGADSVVSNAQYNQAPLCPDVKCVQADAETDATGTTYVTLMGATLGSPGVGTPNPLRKWGHYDTEIPVFVLGFKIDGRLTVGQANGTYVLQVKNYDHTGGLGTALNQGEAVTSADFNAIANNIGVNNALTHWRDFNSFGGIESTDFNLVSQHVTHDCDTPNNP